MTVSQKTLLEQSVARLLTLFAITVVVAMSVIQGAYLPGIIAGVGILILYYIAKWVREGEGRRSRIDLVDERLVELEKRVSRIEDRRE